MFGIDDSLSLILAGGSAGVWCVLRIMFGIDDSLSLILAGGSAGAWCVLRIMFGIDDSLAVFGGGVSGSRVSGSWSLEKALNEYRKPQADIP